MGVGGGDVAEADLAEVEPVGEHAADGESGPGLVLAGPLAWALSCWAMARVPTLVLA